MENWITVEVLICLTFGMVACSACTSYIASQYGITPVPLKMSSDPDMEFVNVVRAPTSDPYYDTVSIQVKNNANRAKTYCSIDTRVYTHQTDTTSRLSHDETLYIENIGPGETKTVEFRLCSNYTTSTRHTWLGCEYEIGELSCS
jgi:hypothetical protein